MYILDLVNPAQNITTDIILSEKQLENVLINLEHQILTIGNISNFRSLYEINNTEYMILYIVSGFAFIGFLPCFMQCLFCKILKIIPCIFCRCLSCLLCIKQKKIITKFDIEELDENNNREKLITP